MRDRNKIVPWFWNIFQTGQHKSQQITENKFQGLDNLTSFRYARKSNLNLLKTSITQKLIRQSKFWVAKNPIFQCISLISSLGIEHWDWMGRGRWDLQVSLGSAD